MRVSILILVGFCIAHVSYSQTSINENIFLVHQNEPIFVIGAYGLPDGVSLAQANQMGFNVIHGTNHLDEAQQLGMYVWSSFGGQMDFESGDTAEKKQRIQSTVKKYKNHPALLFWESMDEPAWTNKKPELARTSASSLTQGYEYLKTLDDTHPVYLNHAPRNMVETLQEYNSAADIICADIYPIIPKNLPTTYAITPDSRHGDLPNQTPSCVGEYVDKMKQVADADQPVFIVLQGFSWGVTVDGAKQERFLQYPTYAESRFMAMQSIVHHVNGLMYWGLHLVPKEHQFLENLGKVLNEVKEFSPIILHGETLPPPKLNYHERGSTITNGIEMMSKKYNGEIFIIAVNTSIDPAAVDFHNLPNEYPTSGIITVQQENRTIPLKNGTWFDEFDGLGVHVYHIQ
jgi:hypothetical protein